MNVLAIDTSSRLRMVCVVATVEGALVHAEVGAGRAVDTDLPRAIAALATHTYHAVLAVSGPGSYTGVRAGMAAALGVAHACGVPLFTAGSLEVVAANGGAEGWAVADAGRGGLYVARFTPAGLAAPAARVAAAEFDPGALPVYTMDEPAAGWHHVDPATALAAVVPRAAERGAVALASIRADYAD